MGKGSREVHIRWMIRKDLFRVLEVESECFTNPWSEEDILRHLRQRNCIGMVAVVDRVIRGFMVYQLNKRGIELINIAVHPDYWRLGYGTVMVEKLKSKLSVNRRQAIDVFVCESNLDGQLFFREQGFRAISIIYGHFGDGHDAYLFRHRIEGATQSLRQSAIRGLIT